MNKSMNTNIGVRETLELSDSDLKVAIIKMIQGAITKVFVEANWILSKTALRMIFSIHVSI